MSDNPILMRWEGDGFQPRPRSYWAKISDERFVVGQLYLVTAQGEQSERSRGHFFATLHEHWLSLPDHLLAEYPTSEHLRKFALIRAGFYERESWTFQTEDDARIASTALGRKDDICLVVVNGCEVSRYTAKSQRAAVMGKADFARSKDAVLAYCRKLLGVEE